MYLNSCKTNKTMTIYSLLLGNNNVLVINVKSVDVKILYYICIINVLERCKFINATKISN